jgi:hypothetical protein
MKLLIMQLKLSLCLTNKSLGREHVWGVEVWIHVFLASALFGNEWSASRPADYNRGKSPMHPLEKRCLGRPRTGPDDVEKRETLLLLGLEFRNLGHPTLRNRLYRLNRASGANVLLGPDFTMWIYSYLITKYGHIDDIKQYITDTNFPTQNQI